MCVSPEIKNEKTYGSRTCKPNSVRRIADGTVIPLGHASLRGSSDLPEGFTHRAGTCRNLILANQVPAPFLFGLAPCVVCPARCIAAAAVRSYRTFSPLPASRRCGRYVFCGTFRRTGLNPPSRTLSGTLL